MTLHTTYFPFCLCLVFPVRLSWQFWDFNCCCMWNVIRKCRPYKLRLRPLLTPLLPLASVHHTYNPVHKCQHGRREKLAQKPSNSSCQWHSQQNLGYHLYSPMNMTFIHCHLTAIEVGREVRLLLFSEKQRTLKKFNAKADYVWFVLTAL